MANEFLIKEYELCFEQLRFYDTRHENLLKYLCSLTAAIATAQFALFQVLRGVSVGFFRCSAVLSALVFIATSLLFVAMLQNRLYFVFVARQLNAIRGFMMRTAAEGFRDNQMYTSVEFPALKPLSLQTVQLLGSALISSGFAGASILAIGPGLGREPYWWISSSVALTTVGIELGGAAAYLIYAGKKKADEIIHCQTSGSKVKHR